MYVYISIYIYIYIYVCACMHTYIYIYMYIYIEREIHASINVYIHMHMPTYMHMLACNGNLKSSCSLVRLLQRCNISATCTQLPGSSCKHTSRAINCKANKSNDRICKPKLLELQSNQLQAKITRICSTLSMSHSDNFSPLLTITNRCNALAWHFHRAIFLKRYPLEIFPPPGIGVSIFRLGSGSSITKHMPCHSVASALFDSSLHAANVPQYGSRWLLNEVCYATHVAECHDIGCEASDLVAKPNHRIPLALNVFDRPSMQRPA